MSSTGAAESLPKAIEYEKAILAAALVDPGCVSQIIEQVKASDFYTARHQAIMRAIGILHFDGVRVELPALAEKLKEMGDPSNDTGAYIAELISEVPAATNLEHYCGLIRQAARNRAAMAAMSEALQTGGDPKQFGFAAAKVMEALQKRDAEYRPSSHVFDEPVRIADLIARTPPVTSFFAKDRVPAGLGILVTGVGGSSKTRILYHLGIGAVIGQLPWSWTIELPGKAILVLTEDVEEDAWRVIHAFASGLTPEQQRAIDQQLFLFPLAGKDVKLLIRNSRGTLERSPLFYELAEKVKAIDGVAFVGIDPALSVTEGDELDQGHQRALGKMVDDLAIMTGATVALVSHSTKASLNTPELSSHNSRGGGAITDAVRAEYSMRNMTFEEAVKAGIKDIQERKRHVQLVCTKANSLPPSAFVPVWLRRDENGMLRGVELNFDSRGRADKKDIQAFEALVELSEQVTPTLKEWRDECVKREIIKAKSADSIEKAMQRIIKKLIEQGMVKEGLGRGIYVPATDDEQTN